MRSAYRVLFILSVLLVSACQLIPVYRPDIQQGNIISQSQVDKLRPGMTPAQVLYIMGPPVLKQNFVLNRWDYVYTMKKPGKKMVEKRLTIYFRDNKLVQMSGTELPHAAVTRDVYPAPSNPTPYQRESHFY